MTKINSAKALEKELNRHGLGIDWLQTASDTWEGDIIGTQFAVWMCEQSPCDLLYKVVAGSMDGIIMEIKNCEIKHHAGSGILTVRNSGAYVNMPCK